MIGNGTKIWHPELSNIHENAVIGDNCVIHSHVWIGEGVEIGNGVKIQAFCFIPTGVKIQDNCFIGPRVTFMNDKYPPSGRENWLTTIVEKGAVIGANTTIVCGIKIGRNAKIGVASLITKDVPDNTMVYGVPAKIIKQWK